MTPYSINIIAMKSLMSETMPIPPPGGIKETAYSPPRKKRWIQNRTTAKPAEPGGALLLGVNENKPLVRALWTEHRPSLSPPQLCLS